MNTLRVIAVASVILTSACAKPKETTSSQSADTSNSLAKGKKVETERTTEIVDQGALVFEKHEYVSESYVVNNMGMSVSSRDEAKPVIDNTTAVELPTTGQLSTSLAGEASRRQLSLTKPESTALTQSVAEVIMKMADANPTEMADAINILLSKAEVIKAQKEALTLGAKRATAKAVSTNDAGVAKVLDAVQKVFLMIQKAKAEKVAIAKPAIATAKTAAIATPSPVPTAKATKVATPAIATKVDPQELIAKIIDLVQGS